MSMPSAGEVILVIHWKGGVHTELRVPRRRRGQNSAHTSKDIIEAVRVLARICPDDLLANILNRNGLLTGRGNRWTRERVVSLRTHHDIPCYDRDRRDVRRMDESDGSRSRPRDQSAERSGSPSSEARSRPPIPCLMARGCFIAARWKRQPPPRSSLGSGAAHTRPQYQTSQQGTLSFSRVSGT